MPHPNRLYWPVSLALAAILGSLAIACMMPFVALAVIAAATLSRRGAAITVAAAWAVNQGLGFALLGFPVTIYSVAWGGALLAASLAAIAMARLVAGHRDALSVPRLTSAFLVGFAGYEALLFGFALFMGGTETFTPEVILRLAVAETIWFVGLALLHQGLVRAVPYWFADRSRLRPA
jgi:hypothetical protein